MSHNFLFDTYKFIDERLEGLTQDLVDVNAGSMDRQYAAGRVDALCEVERFLDSNIKQMLPKRLKRNIPRTSRVCSDMSRGVGSRALKTEQGLKVVKCLDKLGNPIV